jgi:N-acetylmuramic acid 6-phosphate etherase
MLENLLTEQVNPASHRIDALPTLQVLEIINAEDRQVAGAVAREIPAIARAVDAIVEALHAGGRLFYIGAGTSGRLGVLDAAECPPTFSADPEMVQGIMAGGETALARPTETTCANAVSPPAICCLASPPAGARPMCWARSPKPAA